MKIYKHRYSVSKNKIQEYCHKVEAFNKYGGYYFFRYCSSVVIYLDKINKFDKRIGIFLFKLSEEDKNKLLKTIKSSR